MRVALITDDTYPYVPGGVGDWCHRLLHGLDRHAFEVVALHAGRREPAYTVPAGTPTHPVPERPPAPAGRAARNRHRRAATAAAVLLCRGVLAGGDQGATLFAEGLRRLAELARGGTIPMYGVPLADVLLDAWQAARGAVATEPPLPRLSVRDARTAAELLEYAVRPLAVRLPAVDLAHAVSAGRPLLVALAAQWQAGTPFLLTEHGTYLRTDSGPFMLRFYRALARLGYAEAALVATASRFHQRWQLRNGADPAKIVVVPGGVEPLRYAPLETEPPSPTVVWVGNIAPHKDLHTLIRAFRRIREAVPHAGLRLVGPATDAGYAQTCRRLVDRLRLGGTVEFAGPAPTSRHAYATGQVAALSSVAEGTPDTLIEAMLCARPTVSTDVGAVAEAVGDTGLVVPPADPVAFATACVELLADPVRRRELGGAGRARALRHFTVDPMRRAYDHLYRDAVAS
ncbi:GT4 family glycosyltransferase PelF [Phytohabitans rumicis]|uniref:GT4 family glycosyltransferase PelF n=1 Tax=Phytohabitans rumicis TaxID=1076125 RepID=UPI0031EA5667